MDSERFVRELPALFEDFPRSEHPLDRRFAPILEQIRNFTSENVLTLLNLAASCLDDGESHVEVGVYHGAGLVATVWGNEGKDVVGIDDFRWEGTSVQNVRESFAAFGLPVPETLVGDLFQLGPAGALADRRVGVWYYDAAHDYAAQVEGLRIAEPLLVPGALLIVDDTDWMDVSGRWTTTLPPSRRPAACS